MLARLALGNIRRTLRDYAVYAVTLVIGVAVFYAFNTIAVQADFLEGERIADTLRSVRQFVMGLTVALAVVMGFLMVYANGFLMRRRTRELGLYQVLGMSAGQVNLVLVIETLLVAAVSLVAGLALGMLLSQLMTFATAALFETRVTNFRFFVSGEALGLTVGCFVLMFLVMMALNTRTLARVRLVELMEDGRRNERPGVRSLRASVVLFVVGVALVAVAYATLSTYGIPGFGSSFDSQMNRDAFALATALVTVGTVLLFLGLAGTATALLSRSRGYWRDLNMFTVRQVASRVNTASLSMALVAMVLFLAVTSVTAGIMLVRVENEQTRASTPFDASVIGIGYGDAEGATSADVVAGMREVGLDPASLGSYAQVALRSPWEPDTVDSSAAEQTASDLSIGAMASSAGMELTGDLAEYEDVTGTDVMSLSDYNALRALRGMGPVEMGGDQYLVLAGDGFQNLKPVLDAALAHGHVVHLAGATLSPARGATVDDGSQNVVDGDARVIYVLVAPDAVAERCELLEPLVDIMYAGDASVADQAVDAVADALGGDALVYTRSRILQEHVGNRGLVTYLAVYIGLVLVVACAAILAIQQLSAASDATGNYRVLAELGCPERLVWRSLRTQVAVAFVLPLVVALAHSACALRVVGAAFFGYYPGLAGPGLVAGTQWAVMAFVLVYGAYLLLTYRTARGVVAAGLRSARRSE